MSFTIGVKRGRGVLRPHVVYPRSLLTLSDEQLEMLWERAHEGKYRFGITSRHAYRVGRIERRIEQEEFRRWTLQN